MDLDLDDFSTLPLDGTSSTNKENGSSLHRLQRAWISERCAPDILPYETRLIDTISTRLREQVVTTHPYWFWRGTDSVDRRGVVVGRTGYQKHFPHGRRPNRSRASKIPHPFLSSRAITQGFYCHPSHHTSGFECWVHNVDWQIRAIYPLLTSSAQFTLHRRTTIPAKVSPPKRR